MATVQPPFTTFPEVDQHGDAPLPPPASVRAVIPPFDSHGELACGGHCRYEAEFPESNGMNNTALCTSCRDRTALSLLHDLPCGRHILCRECLEMVANRVKWLIGHHWTSIRNMRTHMQHISSHLRQHPGLDEEERMRLQSQHSRYRLGVLELAGLACCGVSMKVNRFLACLSPAVSRDLWLSLRWISDSPGEQRSCAWPDCGAYLPVCCRYPAIGDYRWYCVTCKGNSMECARTLPATQLEFPCLPKGQPALTPCS